MSYYVVLLVSEPRDVDQDIYQYLSDEVPIEAHTTLFALGYQCHHVSNRVLFFVEFLNFKVFLEFSIIYNALWNK